MALGTIPSRPPKEWLTTTSGPSAGRRRRSRAVTCRSILRNLDAFFEKGHMIRQCGRLPIGPVDTTSARKTEDQRFQHRPRRLQRKGLKPRIQPDQIRSTEGLIILRHSYTLPLTTRSGIAGTFQSKRPGLQRRRRCDPEALLLTIGCSNEAGITIEMRFGPVARQRHHRVAAIGPGSTEKLRDEDRDLRRTGCILL